MINSSNSREKMLTTLVFALLAGLSLMIFVSQAYARVSTPRGDEVVEQASAVDAVGFSMTLANFSAATSTVLADLSDTTNFKHSPNSGGIDLFRIRFDWSTNGTASTTLRIGVIASSTPAGNLVDVFWFDTISFASRTDGAGEQRQTKEIVYLPAIMNLRVSAGIPTAFVTSDKDLASNKFATTTKYWSPRGAFTANPGVGDLVMEIYAQTGSATTSASGLYRVTE